MSEEFFCEPCRRLLLGDLSVVSNEEDSFRIYFDHHLNHESFDRAMQLPCLLCTLAWTNAQNSPYRFGWEKLMGEYFCSSDNERTLVFFADHRDNFETWSSYLFLKHLSSFTEISICHALSSNTSDALHFLLEQFHNCCASHAQCSNLESPHSDQYPSRLLDVGSEGSPIILRSTRMFRDQEYVCLSHCWGESKPYILNSITQGDLESGIDAADLPKTFQDAIHVTRCLRMRYLWIDSLCILQDSEADWSIESARMDQIYARAACTIAATAAGSSDGGLFFDRHPGPQLPRVLEIQFDSDAPWLRGKAEGFRLEGTYLCDIRNMAEYCIEKAPLNSRAWVSQERQLSRRIMHFSNSHLFWECHKSTTCETYPNGVPDEALPFWFNDPTVLKRHLHEFRPQDPTLSSGSTIPLLSELGLTDELYRAWCSFRVKYSDSALSRENDKLVALRGIAKQVSRATGDELIAGLWKSRIVDELCWFKRMFHQRNPPVEPTEWRAPTWSWAASNSIIWISPLVRFHRGHERRYLETDLIDLDVGTKLSGELTHGSMRIECKPMLAMVIPIDKTPWNEYEYQLEGHLMLIEDVMHSSDATLAEGRVKVPSNLNMDDLNVYEPQQVYIVVIQRCLHEDPVQDDDRNDVQDSDKSSILSDSQGSVLEDGEKSVQSQEVIVEPWHMDMLEGLLLQPNYKDSTTFSRIGMFHLKGSGAVRPILEAHLKAARRVITLI